MSKSKKRKAEEWQLNRELQELSLFSFSKQCQSRERINFKCLERKNGTNV